MDIDKLDLDYLRTTQPPVEALIAMARTINALIDAGGYAKKPEKPDADAATADKDKTVAKAGETTAKAGEAPKPSEAPKPKPA